MGYVHEEMIDGKPLTQIINETNENVKYLKGAKFTPNVVAEPSLEKAVEGATMVCFCLPHQFLKPLMPAIKASVAPGAKALSAIKGIDFDDKGIVLISDIIRQELSADCSVLMGAIMRIGLLEMKKFANMFYKDIDDDTFLESCGVADLITTCYGGRNRKCAEAFAKAGKKKSLDEIEAELLGGQKLQGMLTAKEVNHVLKMKGLEHEFPFFTAVYQISYEDTPLEAICTTPYWTAATDLCC